MDKTKIIDLLKKNEMTVYDIGMLFEYMGKFFKEFERSIVLNAEYAIEDSEGLIAKAKEMLSSVDTWLARVDEKSQKISRESERLINDIYAQHTKFKEKMEGLPVFTQNFVVPYGIKEMLDLAERCSHINDNAWLKVIELAKALNPKLVP